MRVTNIITSDKNKYQEVLAKALCLYQVPYVQVENEFHFSDKIYRIYNYYERIEDKAPIQSSSRPFELIPKESVQKLLLKKYLN